jgi:hypothetical protein
MSESAPKHTLSIGHNTKHEDVKLSLTFGELEVIGLVFHFHAIGKLYQSIAIELDMRLFQRVNYGELKFKKDARATRLQRWRGNAARLTTCS